MAYPSYQDYQEHEVEFLGQLPRDWKCRRLRFTASEPLMYGANEAAGSEDRSFPRYIRITDIKSDGTLYDDTFRSLPEELAKPFLLQEGDILLARSGATVGKSFQYSKNWGIAAYAGYLIRYRTDQEVISSCFANYYFQTKSYWACIQSTLIQSTIENFSAEKYRELYLPLPDKSEQEQIVNFLDWKTEQIDALISKKKQLLEKLKEKRIAMITQAVTKGLNPDAPMRDSGIPWLGEIPRHWDVKPVKFLTRILRGQFSHRPRNDPAYYDGEYPFVQTGDIARSGKYVTEYSQTLNDLGLSVSKQFPAGTLVMTIAANIGDMAIIEFEACFPDSIVGFVPENDVDIHFLYYMFVAMKQRLLMTAVLNTQLNLNIERVGSIKTIQPPLSIQQEIVKFLDQRTYHVDALITKNDQLIEKLSEYRTALITAATTGNIDVRNVKIRKGEGGSDSMSLAELENNHVETIG